MSDSPQDRRFFRFSGTIYPLSLMDLLVKKGVDRRSAVWECVMQRDLDTLAQFLRPASYAEALSVDRDGVVRIAGKDPGAEVDWKVLSRLKRCTVCASVFESRRHHQRYCTNKCKREGQRPLKDASRERSRAEQERIRMEERERGRSRGFDAPPYQCDQALLLDREGVLRRIQALMAQGHTEEQAITVVTREGGWE